MSKPVPIDKDLYKFVVSLANKKFDSPSGIYRSSWIVREYKKRNGRYSGTKNEKTGLKRWYKEDWVDLNRPIKNKKGVITGYEKCGRESIKGKYPLCRPSKRITSKTPKTYHEISKKRIEEVKKIKAKYKSKKNISFDKPRKYSKKYCTSTPCNKMGFSQKASCRYYVNCYLSKNI